MIADKVHPKETKAETGSAANAVQVQCSLAIGAVNDPLEHEADTMADRVMSMQEVPAVGPAGAGGIQRKCAGCEEEEKVQRKPLASFIQRKESSVGTVASDAVSSQINASKGSGSNMDSNTQSFMQSRFGTDFWDIKIHTGGEAIQMNRELNAKAFTVGNDIYFNEGQYNPGSNEGKHLLAHELTHTVQQQGGEKKSQVQRKIQVNPGRKLDTQGFTTTKTGDIYTCPAVVKGSVWNEIFTSLLHSPRIFKVAGSTDADVTKNFLKHMTARYDIVEFASKKKYKFPSGGSGITMNTDFWEHDSTGWHEKAGVERKTAINDLNVHPDEYAIACNSATALTLEGGSKSSVRIMENSVASNDWIPGEAGYIENTKFTSASSFGTEGENIIYTGKDLFWGHFGPGNTFKSLVDWLADVKSWDGEAVIKTHRLRTNVGLE